MRRSIVLLVVLAACVGAGLTLAIPVGAQIVDFGTWDMSSSQQAKEAGIGSLSVTRDGLHTQSRDKWIVYVEVFDPDASLLGSMEFRWPSEKSNELKWNTMSGESFVVRLETEGFHSMEFEDIAAGEFVRWDWLCDMEALRKTLKTHSFKSREEIDASREEFRRCSSEVSVTGTDMESKGAMDRHKPVWEFVFAVEDMVRTRMGFSHSQLYRKRREAEEARETFDSSLLKFVFCPGGGEKVCVFPDTPNELKVIGDGFGFSSSSCCDDARDEANEDCTGRTGEDCCHMGVCMQDGIPALCPPLCFCSRIGVYWSCTVPCA